MNEAYSVLVKIALQNEVSKGLLLMSGQFKKLDQQATAFESRLKNIKALGMMGAGFLAGGLVGVHFLDKMIKPASEYQHQLALMNVSGMKHLEIVKATQAAWKANQSVPTSTAVENLAAIQHLRMVFGDTSHAIEYMPIVQKIQAVLKTVKGSSAGDESYELAKALEMKGAVKTPQEFTMQADAMAKAIIASGGKVGAGDFLSTFKYGRAATSGWSDEFTYTILPTLIQEMKSRGGSGGGGGPGNALMSAYATVVGGTIPQKSLKVWQKLGLLDPSKIVWDKVGSAKGVAPGGIRGSEDFISNPYTWAQDTLLPSLKKAGYETEAQQKQALQYLFPNRTANFVMTQLVMQAWKFQRDQKLINQTSGLESYNTLLKNDPQLAAMALQKQWENLMAILGYQIMPALLHGAQILIPELTSLSLWFKSHERLAKALVFTFAGLSLAMAFGGTVLLLTAAIKGLGVVFGLMALPITALSAPVLGIIAGLSLVGFGFYKLWQLLKSIDFKPLINGFKGIWGSITGRSTNQPSTPPVKIGSKTTLLDVLNPVKNRDSQPIQVHSQVSIDGRAVAQTVTQHQAKQASSPNFSSRFDTSLTPVPVGFNF